jgi:hypothetical protein
VLARNNTISLLKALLQRRLYEGPLELKQNRHIWDAVLFALDVLVEPGSSAVFRMRDDFVTPVA